MPCGYENGENSSQSFICLVPGTDITDHPLIGIFKCDQVIRRDQGAVFIHLVKELFCKSNAIVLSCICCDVAFPAHSSQLHGLLRKVPGSVHLPMRGVLPGFSLQVLP